MTSVAKTEPLSAVQLNQLLVLGHVAPVADGFFRYYWLQAPEQHPYSVRDLPDFSEDWLGSEGAIASLAHLRWGLYRLYVDALLYFGNVRTAFRKLRDRPIAKIEGFFRLERFDTEAIKRRGPSLPLKSMVVRCGQQSSSRWYTAQKNTHRSAARRR